MADYKIPHVTSDCQKIIYTFEFDPTISDVWGLLFSIKIRERTYNIYSIAWIKIDDKGEPELRLFPNPILPRCLCVNIYKNNMTISIKKRLHTENAVARMWVSNVFDALKLNK